MASIPLPSILRVSSQRPSLDINQRIGASPFGGSEQVVDVLNDRWRFSLSVPVMNFSDAAQVESYINSMRGQVNTSPMHHMARPQPRGTARGTMVLAANAAQGAASIQISGVSPANGTLLAGDMIGVSGLLLQVGADATAAAGVITVTLNNRLRKALTSGAAVTWDKPSIECRLMSATTPEYGAALTTGVEFEYSERIV